MFVTKSSNLKSNKITPPKVFQIMATKILNFQKKPQRLMHKVRNIA